MCKLNSSSKAQGTVEYLVIVSVVIVLSLVVVGLVLTQVDSSQQVSSSSNALGLSTQVIGVTESLVSPSDGNFVVKLLNNSGDFITVSNVKVGDRNVNFSEDLAQGASKFFRLNPTVACTPGKVVSSSVVITYVTRDGLSKSVTYPAQVMFDCSPYVIEQANLANQCPSVPTFDGTADVDKVLAGYSFFSDSSTKQMGQLVPLPKTGQTTSYVSYDDGYYQKGSSITPRYVDNGDGTISDRSTNLMWVKEPAKIIPGASVIASNQIQRARSDWASSTEYLIGDLVKAITTEAGAITASRSLTTVTASAAIFSDADLGREIFINNVSQGWVLRRTSTTVVVVSGSGTTASNPVSVKSLFVNIVDGTSGEGTFTADPMYPASWVETFWTTSAINLTSPVWGGWEKDSATSRNGITMSENLNYAGYQDWRLPNINEMGSLVVHASPAPLIDKTFFPNTPNSSYWTSTTMATTTTYVLTLAFSNGFAGMVLKTNTGHYFRPVRGGN